MVDPKPLGDLPPEVHIEPTLRTGAGSPVTARLVVVNRCAEPRVLAITAHGLDAGWLPPPLRTRPVLPGASVTVDLVIRPAIGTVPARYPLAVSVQALDPASGQSTTPTSIADSVVVVDAPGEVSISLTPADSSAVFGQRVRITVQNTGAMPASVDLELRVPTSVRARMSAPSIVVDPGRTAEVRARIKPHPVRIFGQRIRHAYTVTARSAGAPRHAAGSFTSRALFGPSATKAGALIAVVAVWLALAAVFVPKLADHFAKKNTTTVAQSAAPTGSNSGSPKGGGRKGSGGGGGGGSSKGGGGNGGGGGGSGAGGGAGGASANAVQLSGTITGNSPGQVLVTITQTSLVKPKALGATTVGAPAAGFADVGMVPAEAVHVSLPGTPQQQHVLSAADGTWRLGNVAKPGFYELTFQKAGYQTRRYIIDSSAAVAGQPLQVAMAPGQGRLSGIVRGPHGPVAGATVTITDGAVTIATTSNSRGNVGQWSVDGLSTPDSYVVSATQDGLSTESALVNLPAGGSQSVGLTLHRGVVSLKGKISGRGSDGVVSGLPGAQITATSGNVTRTATAVTPRGVKGQFILPDLPVGTYTITASAPGFEPQTSRLTLHAGSSQATLNRTLTSATATLGGVISTSDGADPTGAGLVLSSATNTYKTTATSDPKPGSYAFDGVEPGTYVLSTQLFGYNTDTVTVTLTAGEMLPLNRTLQAQPAGVLPASSHIQGQVLDARTGGPITCPTGEDHCVTAQVTDQLVDGSQQTYSTSFLPSEQYTLPDPKTDPEKGLLPGLHTVTIGATGYESDQVNVAVPLGGLVTAPTVSLFPAPKIVGVITSGADPPAAPTCIWAVSGSSSIGAGALPACGSNSATPPGCPDKAGWPAGTSCANPLDGSGNPASLGAYTLETPAHGVYIVYVQSADPEFQTAAGGLAVAAASLNLPQGSVVGYSPILHRFGRIEVTVLHPGPNGDLVPVSSGVTVDVGSACPPSNPKTFTTDPNGLADIRDLPSGTYTLSASVPDQNTSGNDTGCLTGIATSLDRTANVTLQLTHAVDALVGRAVYNLDGQPTPISGASVNITGASGYNGTSTTLALWQMTSDPDGCFGIHSAAAPPNSPPKCPSIGTEGAPFVSDQTGRGIKLLSNIVSVQISAPGFVPLVLDKQSVDLSTVTDFTLTPNPTIFTSGGGVNTLDVLPVTDTPDWSQARVTVAEVDGLAHGITVSLTGSGTEAVLTWHDPNLPVNQVQPGTYTLTATLPGYLTATTKLTCTAGPSATCTMDPKQPFVLQKLASLTMTTQDPAGNPVDGATFILTDNGTQVGSPVTAASGSATSPPFSGLTPGDANLRVAIQAAGYRFTTANALNYTLTCNGSAVSAIPAPDPGGSIACTATLEPLGTITGTVNGIQAVSPATTPTSPIGGATVTAQQCAATAQDTDGTTYCTQLTANGASFQVTAAASTSASPGTYAITGTNAREGLSAGWWMITAHATGYCDASSTASGNCPATLPSSVAGGGKPALGIAVPVTTDGNGVFQPASASPTLYQEPTHFVVNATDGAGKPASGLTLTLSGGNLQSALTATEGTGNNKGTYTFPLVVPGTYNLTATGDGYLGTGMQVPVAVGAGPFPLSVARGTNTVTGTVIGQQGTNATATALAGVTVCILSSKTGDCNTPADVVSGTDDNPLSTTTGADGTFSFSTVPDTPAKGSYFVSAELYGYDTYVGSSFVVKHTGQVSHDEQITMTRVVWQVVVTVTASSTSDSLSGAVSTDATLKSVHSASAPDNTDLAEKAAAGSATNAFTVTEAQVPYGCWSLGYDVSQLGDHYGTLSLNTPTSTDATLKCPSGSFAVPGTPPGSGAEIDVGYTLNEDELDLTVNATALAPDTVPAVEVTATNSSSKIVYDHTFDAVATTTSSVTPTIWVPDDSYTINAAVSPASGAWPAATPKTVTVPGTKGAAATTLPLKESAATLNVTVTGVPKGEKVTSVTATCTQSQTLPSGCDSGIALTLTKGVYTHANMAPGSWTVVVTLDSGDSVSQDVTLTGGQALAVTMPSAKSSPTAFPTPTPTATPTPTPTPTP